MLYGPFKVFFEIGRKKKEKSRDIVFFLFHAHARTQHARAAATAQRKHSLVFTRLVRVA